jgi:hypothetical protein
VAPPTGPHERVSEVYPKVENREEWLRNIETTSLHKFAAVCYSEVSRDFYERGDPTKYVNSFQGVSKALLECHISFDIIVDRQMNLKDLSEYKVDTDFPSVVCGKYGKGQTVNSALQAGAIYATSSYPEHKMMLTNIAIQY